MVKRRTLAPKFFYGYWILASVFLCNFVQTGCVFYSFSLFIRPLEEEFRWGRGDIMAAFTICFLLTALTSPFVGRLLDRYGARAVIPAGALLVGLGFVMLGTVNDLWYFYISYALIGIGGAAIGPLPTSALVSNWFQKRRGLALGIMATGMGAGGLTMALFIGGYLIPYFSWRVSYVTLALTTWVLIIPLALFVIRTRPADVGLYPDGIQVSEAASNTETIPSASEGLTLKMALYTGAFWLIFISFLLSQFSQVGTLQSQVPHFQDIGFPVLTAATALGIVSLVSAIGKLGFGLLCDWIPAKYACAIGITLQTIGIAVLLSTTATSPPLLIWVYAIIIGLGTGSWLPSFSMVVSSNFGLANYGAIFGIMISAENFGLATGPLLAGFMYDAMNTYRLAFIVFLALTTISIFTILFVRRPKFFPYPRQENIIEGGC